MVCLNAFAEKTGVRVDDISTTEDTSIVIKKGATEKEYTEYQIVEGKDEIYGDPDYDRRKAYASWKDACTEWKKSMREMNKDSKILTLNCNQPTAKKDDLVFTYSAFGTYKMKVPIREKK